MAETNTPDFNRSPLVIPAAAFAGGIVLANLVQIQIVAAIAATILFSLVAIFLRGQAAATVAVLIAFITAGALSLKVDQRSISDNRIRTIYDAGRVESGAPVEVEGTLAIFPEAAYEGSFLTIAAENLFIRSQPIPVSGKVRVFVPNTQTEFQISDVRFKISDLKYGSRVRIACNLEREDEFRNPGVAPRREILDRQGIDAACSVKSALLVEHLADESVFVPLAAVYRWRASWIDTFREKLNPRTSGVMIASLLGNKHFLDRETGELFRDGGTFHILVISGLHITFIGGVLYFFVTRLTRNRWLRFFVVNLTLAAYTIAVGADVPVVRATVMFAILSLGATVFRQINLLNSLAASALVLLVWRPSDLFNPSFQLTFVSVGAIVAIAFPLLTRMREIGEWIPDTRQPLPPNVATRLGRFCEAVYWNPAAWQIESGRQVWSGSIEKNPYLPRLSGTALQRYARYIFEAGAISLIVQIAMLPLLVVYFHTVSFSAVVLNIWVGVFIAVESFAAVFGTFVLQLSSFFAEPFFRLAELSNALMLFLPRLIAGDGMTRFRVPAYVGDGRVFYAVIFVSLVTLAVLLNRWGPFALRKIAGLRRRAVLALAATLVPAAIIIAHPFSAAKPDGRLRVDFIDVGQGDAALVTFPDGTTMLIDGGGRVVYRARNDEMTEAFEPDVVGIGEFVVSNVLWARGLSSLDYVVATHADADHIEGLNDIVRNFDVGGVWFEKTAGESADFAELAGVLGKKPIALRNVAAGDVLSIGGVLVEILSPTSGDPSLISDNNRSLVLKFTFGERSFLFTGDIERPAEQRLVVSNIDVVKVAHHGSRTSSSQQFIDSTRSKIAIISVGRRSQFGHPHAEVVERWIRSGTTLLTTGTSGMVSVSTDGRDLQLDEFVSGIEDREK